MPAFSNAERVQPRTDRSAVDAGNRLTRKACMRADVFGMASASNVKCAIKACFGRSLQTSKGSRAVLNATRG